MLPLGPSVRNHLSRSLYRQLFAAGLHALLLSLLAATSFGQSANGDTPLPNPVPTSAKDTVPDTKLTFRVYNYAKLDSDTIERSEKAAAAIFRQVGIVVRWIDCPTSARDITAKPYRTCDSQMSASDLVLKILPHRMARKLPRSNDALGSAQVCPPSEPACQLNLFSQEIDDLAIKGFRADRILGYAIAHEAAHVLVGRAHSEDGIMRAAWTSSDLQRISNQMEFDFTLDQSRQLRAAVQRKALYSAPSQGIIQAHLFAP